ncbi:MAG: VWA domain-containing protein, partial [Bacteroidales bacterium]|nr:VWA domain-containing protein [Bacteroidales bacterium]
MLRFAHPEYFYLLLVIPAALLLFVMNGRARRKRIALFGDEALMKRLIPDRSAFRVNLRLVVWSLALAALAVALASPQLGSKLDKVKARGVDIMVALDVSNSMLSQDVKPNRLDNAKLAISKLIDNLRSDRIGMVVFAGKGYVQLPITTDYAAAKMFLSNINTTLVPTQGTAIGQALEMASESFNEEARSRAIIVITDGENHEGDAVETARQIADSGVKIYTIGIGSPSRAPIPEFAPNGTQTGFKKDNTGNTVVTKLNEGMLQQIAAAGNGAYVYAANTNSALKKVQE